ncbi:hypothetical protein DAPPUDRAFT_108320, partial [Daphnia pulex]
MNAYLAPKQRKLLALASQLKAGKGLAVALSILQGDIAMCTDEATTARQNLRKAIWMTKRSRALLTCGKSLIGASRDPVDQFGWIETQHGYLWMAERLAPVDRGGSIVDSWRVFVDTIHTAAANKMALIVSKGISSFPDFPEK